MKNRISTVGLQFGKLFRPLSSGHARYSAKFKKPLRKFETLVKQIDGAGSHFKMLHFSLFPPTLQILFTKFVGRHQFFEENLQSAEGKVQHFEKGTGT